MSITFVRQAFTDALTTNVTVRTATMHHDNDAGTQILTFTVEKPDGTSDTIQDSVNGGGDLPTLARKMAANYSNQAAAPSGTPSANPPSNQ